jgi:hypothetical protein
MKLQSFFALLCIAVFCKLVAAGVEYNEESVCNCIGPKGTVVRCLCPTQQQQQQRYQNVANPYQGQSGYHQSGVNYGAGYPNANAYQKPYGNGFYRNQNYL